MQTFDIDTRQQLLTEFDESSNELVQLLSSFTNEQLNRVPFLGSWTTGQVAEHLVMVHSGFSKLLNGPDKETERAPDELVALIKRDFADYSIKMASPDAVWPKHATHVKEDLLRSLEDIMPLIAHAIQTLDLTKTCTAYEIPQAGFLTRIEAIWFVVSHLQRHLHQLKNIFQKLNQKQAVSQQFKSY